MTVQAPDAFKLARDIDGSMTLEVDDDSIPMLLSYSSVRNAAKNWQTYSSDAPFRVPIPSEETVRSVRQLPIESDPPDHGKYRALLEPFFRRPVQAAYLARIDTLIVETLHSCATCTSFDVVRDFALPIQSRALTYLLGVPETEAQIWIGWGTHVFHDGDDSQIKGASLEAYLEAAIQQAESEPDGDNFFAALHGMSFDGRPLLPAEKLGFANLVFAGGRDTVINAISCIMSFFAQAPEELIAAATDAKSVNLAVEEFIRVISPLTQIGRVCPARDPGHDRVSLCWAAANFDPTIIEAPETINLARSPNPHVGFGSGHHTCLGAPQARAILRSLIRNLVSRVSSIQIVESIQNIEQYGSIRRPVGFQRLMASLELLKP